MEEVTDEPLYRDRVCGIDIGKAGMVATIRVPSDKDPARRAAGDPQLRHHQAGGAGAGGLAALLAGARGGDGGHRATTCEVRVHEFKWEAPLEARLRPVV